MERLRKAGSELIYRCAKQHSEPGSEHRDKRSAKGKSGEELHLTPLELIERIAALIPPSSTHRAAAVALAHGAAAQTAQPLEVRS
jgi:hypothetical protein